MPHWFKYTLANDDWFKSEGANKRPGIFSLAFMGSTHSKVQIRTKPERIVPLDILCIHLLTTALITLRQNNSNGIRLAKLSAKNQHDNSHDV